MTDKKELAEQILENYPDWKFPDGSILISKEDAIDAIIEAMGKPEGKEKWLCVNDMVTRIPDGYCLTEPFTVEFGGDYQLQISPINGKYQVTNGVNGYGNNCKEEFKDAEVKILCESVEAMGVQPGMSEENNVASNSNTDESSVASHSCTVGNSIQQLMQEPIRKKLINDFINRTCYPTAIQGRYGNWMSFSDMLNSFLFDVLNSIDNKAGWVQVGNSEPKEDDEEWDEDYHTECQYCLGEDGKHAFDCPETPFGTLLKDGYD